ncbi:hypothetical protein BN938_2473 [Mucinivorans hirudinis]|uniref:Uncharacterized protein n=1 Tax=Mucinivorans hirudinis TaxID=1433126 RepID=A0A060RBL0_9BACT|nr:hypothetical protein BN938_0669 [Mucinivorans hirudinis]CDN32543.1 hypothetical protein BN938_2473 [Mucinivorans hirudinis]
MKRDMVKISDNGTVIVPANVQMRDFEIAELFGVMVPTIRSNIRAILKTGVATANMTGGATLVGCNVVPDYHGLDMVVAVAFRIQSHKAELFRQWIMCKMMRSNLQPIYIRVSEAKDNFCN